MGVRAVRTQVTEVRNSLLEAVGEVAASGTLYSLPAPEGTAGREAVSGPIS